jgi:hypothetical protein
MTKLSALLLCVTFSLYVAAQPVNLGSTVAFGILAGSTVTNTGPTVINGSVGVSPGNAITGFGPGILVGGTIHAGDAVAAQAQSDLTAAFLDAAGRPCPGPALLGDLGGATILPGVYCTGSSLGITGTVTLNGNGNPNAVFIFQIGSTLVTAANNSNVNLIGGAKASNIFWQVGTSATLGTNTIFNGTILAQASITLTTGAALNGRALARTGAVTLGGNAVAAPPGSNAFATLSLACSFPSGVVGQPYSSPLLATGGIAPYSFSIIAGNLPGGLTLNPTTGAITGTPTTAAPAGDKSRVLDSTGASAASNCGITIAPAVSGGLSLLCASNIGQVGQTYTAALVATGGTPPYTYSISAGSLPTGLTLNPSTGVISGTPTAVGAFNYTSHVVDSTSASASSNCGPFIVVAQESPLPTPAPSSLILVTIGLVCAAIYQSRERLLRLLRRG